MSVNKLSGDRSIMEVIERFRIAWRSGGWIDQPFVSRCNPDSFGSMVVVGLEPCCWYMERAGMATGTQNRYESVERSTP